MSSDSSSEDVDDMRKSILVNRNVKSGVESGAELFAVSESKYIELLLEMFDFLEAGLHSETDLASGVENLGSVVDPPWVLSGSRLRRSEMIGRDGMEGVVVRGIDSGHDHTMLPLEQSLFTEARIFCPVCSEKLSEYSLSGEYPAVSDGVFDSFIQHCSECGSRRPAYTLFAVAFDEPVPRDIFETIRLYWGFMFMFSRFESEEFQSRVEVCREVSAEAGWEFPPDLSRWYGNEFMSFGDVTEGLLLYFYERYFSEVILDQDTNSVVIKKTADCCSGSRPHLHIEGKREILQPVLIEIKRFSDIWDDTTIEVEKGSVRFYDDLYESDESVVGFRVNFSDFGASQ